MASFSTDFDGVGTGEAIRVDFPLNYNVNYSVNLGAGAFAQGHVPEQDAAELAYQQEVERSYHQQYLELQARLQAEAERRREARALEEARQREQARVQGVKNVIADYQALKDFEGSRRATLLKASPEIEAVIVLAKLFDQLEDGRSLAQRGFSQRLAEALLFGNKAPGKNLRSALVLGLWRTPAQAAEMETRGAIDPFDLKGDYFEGVFAFGTAPFSPGPSDLMRVALDHFLSTIDMLSVASYIEASGLRGATVDELVCYSNGCRVVQEMIAAGDLTVNKLRILGGDGVVGEIGNLEALAISRNIKEVSVYVIEGDWVTHTDVCYEIRKKMRSIGIGLPVFDEQRQNPAYQFMGLCDTPPFDPQSRVQVHVLPPPPGVVSPWAKHPYDTYHEMLVRLGASGRMTPDGQMNEKLILHNLHN
jgi:hypothetical protein